VDGDRSRRARRTGARSSLRRARVAGLALIAAALTLASEPAPKLLRGRLEPMGQPNAAHPVLTDLEVFDDALYVASAVRPLALPGAAIWRTEDGRSFTPIALRPEGEGFLRLRAIDGALYAPEADPRGRGEGRILRSEDGRSFRSERVAGVAHTFDVALHQGAVVSASAGMDARGVLHRRTPNGWVRAAPVPALRAHFMASLGGSLFVGLIEPEGSADFVRFRGAVSEDAAESLQAVPGEPVTTRWYVTRAGRIYWSHYAEGEDRVFTSVDGKRWRSVPALRGRVVSDFAEEGGVLYALAGRGIFGEVGDGPFRLVAEAPARGTFGPIRVDDTHRSLDGSASLIAWRGTLWAGSSTDGRLYRLVPEAP
jgi:hypothetical protein